MLAVKRLAWWHPGAASHLPKSWHWGLPLLQLMSARLQGRRWGWQSCCCWSSVKTLLSETHELNSSQHLSSHVNRNQSPRVILLKYSLQWSFQLLILTNVSAGHRVKWWLQEIKNYDISLRSEDGTWKSVVHKLTPLEVSINYSPEWLSSPVMLPKAHRPLLHAYLNWWGRWGDCLM